MCLKLTEKISQIYKVKSIIRICLVGWRDFNGGRGSK